MFENQRKRINELREEGLSAAEATRQARQEQMEKQSREWREAGQRESGGDRKGWGL